MRIISGRWRGRKIVWPDTGNTRPITDRVKESLFDLLGTRYGTPGTLPPLSVGDVFSGGGSMGLEALSRGASKACFFDFDDTALKALKTNFAKLDAGSYATAVRANLWRTGIRPPAAFAPLELVFLDPPFPDAYEISSNSKVGSLLRRFGSSSFCTPDALIVFRHEKKLVFPEPVARHWTLEQQRVYGRSVLSFLVPVAQETESTEQDGDSSNEFGRGC